jgi:signal transduction histidine kinase
MQMSTSPIVLHGKDSQVLEKYCRELAPYSVRIAREEDNFAPIDAASAVIFDLDDLKTLPNLLAMTKKWTKVPIIVITEVREGDFHSLERQISPSIRVLKKPLVDGELVHQLKMIFFEQEAVSRELRERRLEGIRQVLKGVSHELGNLLLRIIGHADLASLGQDLAQVQCNLQGVQDASERARVLVRNLQIFAKTHLHLSRNKLSIPIDQALHSLEADLQRQRIQVLRSSAFESAGGEPEIEFDLPSMVQVFFNLLHNSILAMPDGGTLTIAAAPAAAAPMSHMTRVSAGISIRITDSGQGMTSDVEKRAFEFGFSGRKEKSCGLGLPIARELVEAHGGMLELASKPSQGTEISVWLPC